MTDPRTHFLETLKVMHRFGGAPDLDIQVSEDGSAQHLVLTGPNGSGKTSLIRSLHRELAAYPSGPSMQLASMRTQVAQLSRATNNTPAVRAQLLKQTDSAISQLIAQGAPFVHIEFPSEPPPRTHRVLLYLPATRILQINNVKGPIKIDEAALVQQADPSASFAQFLVNLRTEQAYAREDGDREAADTLAAWFDNFEEHLRRLLAPEMISLHYDRRAFEFSFRFKEDHDVPFDKLPDGLKSVIQIIAAIIIPWTALQRSGIESPTGWVLIDEPELHLHAKLQELLLPLLTDMFPTLQFIVGTHSPEVVASLSNSRVFDLGTQMSVLGSDFHGIRYGTILREHFGIETDFDVKTTRDLKRILELENAKPEHGSEEHNELARLVKQNADIPHVVVALAKAHLRFDS